MKSKLEQPSAEDFLKEAMSESNVSRIAPSGRERSVLKNDDGTREKNDVAVEWCQVNVKMTKAEKIQIGQWALRHEMKMKEVFLDGYRLLREKYGG
jgi:hypothetical protein